MNKYYQKLFLLNFYHKVPSGNLPKFDGPELGTKGAFGIITSGTTGVTTSGTILVKCSGGATCLKKYNLNTNRSVN